ncbi:hypothetical protein FM103_18120 [Corynebacterium xerosis]|nr:hypothetical protein FM103_18120 [Corynebacterium xerosis]
MLGQRGHGVGVRRAAPGIRGSAQSATGSIRSGGPCRR